MRVLIFLGAIVLNVAAFSQAERKFVRKGNKEYEEKDYKEAIKLYRKANSKNPELKEAEFNLGNALYKNNNYAMAISRYEDLTASIKDKNELSNAYYNLGNAYFQDAEITKEEMEKMSYEDMSKTLMVQYPDGKTKMYKVEEMEKSREAYKNALRANPSNNDAKHNLQLVNSLFNKDQNCNQNNKDQKQNKDQQNQQDKNQQGKEQEQQQNQQQNQQQQNQQEKQEQEAQQAQQGSKDDESKEEIERLLNEIERDDNKVLMKVMKEKAKSRKKPVDKNW